MAKTNKNQRTTTVVSEKKEYSFIHLLPIIAVLAVIPLITCRYEYKTNLTVFDWYIGRDTTSDFFLYYKSVGIIIASICMILWLVYMLLSEERKFIWDKKFIPLLIYAFITFLSACFSKNSYFSFHGIYEQFESVWVLIGYVIIAYYCFFVLQSENTIKRVMKWFIIGITVMSALGLSQAFYHDFFRTKLGTQLITSFERSSGLDFTFELGRVYLSAYNPNYVGFYVTLVVPILVALIFATKKLWQRILYALLIVSMLIILFASQSRAGIITIIISLIIMLICMRKVFLKNWKITVAAICIFIAAFIGINAMNHNILLDRMKSMFSVAEEVHPLKSIITNDDNVTINYNDSSLIIKVSQDTEGNDVFELTDGENNVINYALTEEGANYYINDERFPFLLTSVRVEGFYGFQVIIDGKQWYFSNLMKEGDKTYYVLTNSLSLIKLKEQEKTVDFFEKRYHFANMRGYIWARTIPLLKKYFFLGSGPDTFIIAFPNDDLVGIYNSGHDYEIITRPHCMYLQIAVQTGIFSLIALMVFFIWYIVSSMKLYWSHSYEGYLPKVGVAIFVSVIGYLILATTNDSCVTVAPIFYALIGMGLGINHKLKKMN